MNPVDSSPQRQREGIDQTNRKATLAKRAQFHSEAIIVRVMCLSEATNRGTVLVVPIGPLGQSVNLCSLTGALCVFVHLDGI